MYSLTWNSPLDAFENTGGFYGGRCVDDVLIALHKLQEFCGMDKINTFSCHDVIKHPEVPLFLTNLEKHLNKYVLGKEY